MAMTLRETLQLTVAALMHATGDSQSELADCLGLTQTQVSRRQAGHTAWTLDDCDKLAAHFKLPVLDLLAGPTRACEMLPSERRRAARTARTARQGRAAAAPADAPAVAAQLGRPSFSHDGAGR